MMGSEKMSSTTMPSKGRRKQKRKERKREGKEMRRWKESKTNISRSINSVIDPQLLS